MMQAGSRTVANFSQLRQRSMLVLTCVDGALRATDAGSCAAVKSALTAVAAKGVSTILTSHHRAPDLIAIQQELGFRESFIAELGRWLYVPRGRFNGTIGPSGRTDDWEIFEFTPPSVEEAIETLMWLYRVSGDSPLLVGVGASWQDRALLRHVDVPVVISADTMDHHRLRAQFPEAYVTTTAGPDGWREAILGADAAGDESG